MASKSMVPADLPSDIQAKLDELSLELAEGF